MEHWGGFVRALLAVMAGVEAYLEVGRVEGVQMAGRSVETDEVTSLDINRTLLLVKIMVCDAVYPRLDLRPLQEPL
jgi:hypothetical protein